MRQVLILAHRWIAIVVSLFLLLTAASGAALVFEGAIDRGLNPQLWHVNASGLALPIDSVVARVETRLSKGKVSAVNFSQEQDVAWTMNAGGVTAFVNPVNGEIIGTRTIAESKATLSRRLHVLHVEFFSGQAGKAFVGILSGVALFLVVTGMILWWPDKLIRVNTGASWKRINFDLHHAFGICASLVMIVITASGLVVHYDGLASAIKALDRTPQLPPPVQPAANAVTNVMTAGTVNAAGTNGTVTNATVRPSFDAIVTAARNALPGAAVMFVSLGVGKNPASVAMRFAEDHTPGGRSRVFIDRFNNNVLMVSSTRAAQIGTRIDNLKRSLHTGDVFGKVSSVVWLLATLTMVSQIVTGIVMWWNARRGRGRLRKQ